MRNFATLEGDVIVRMCICGMGGRGGCSVGFVGVLCEDILLGDNGVLFLLVLIWDVISIWVSNLLELRVFLFLFIAMLLRWYYLWIFLYGTAWIKYVYCYCCCCCYCWRYTRVLICKIHVGWILRRTNWWRYLLAPE